MKDSEVRKPPDQTMPLLCECGDEACTRPLFATPAEYEAVRAFPRRFLVRAGHEILDVERVVEQGSRFTIVEKREATAHIVEDR